MDECARSERVADEWVIEEKFGKQFI
jgi:hypothetical protein